MDFYSFGPIALLLDGAYWVVIRLQEFVYPVAGEASAALAVVLLTILVRIALIPVGRSQMKAEISRRKLAPHLAELQRKYGKNKEVLQRKTMELYKQEKASPLAGCLPLLLQIPVLSAIYGLFVKTEIHGAPNQLLQATLGGLPLSSNLPSLLAGGNVWPRVAFYLVLLGFMVLIAELQRRFVAVASKYAVTPETKPVSTPVPPGAPAIPDMTRMLAILKWMPYLTVVFAASVPLAAALYLAVTTSWTLAERLILRRVLGRRS